VRHALQPRGGCVGKLDFRIAKYFHLPCIVVRQDRLEIAQESMLAEIGRYIADSQAALRIVVSCQLPVVRKQLVKGLSSDP
jgi:hypothetical protein